MVNLSCPRETGPLAVLDPLELTELGLLLAVGMLVLPDPDEGSLIWPGGGGGGDVSGGAPARGNPTLCILS